MKKIYFYGLASLCSFALNAQVYTPNGTVSSTTNPSTANVGIGVTAPAEKLDVNGNIQALTGIFTKSLISPSTFGSSEARAAQSTVLAAGTLLNATSRARIFQVYDFPQSSFGAAEVFLTLQDRAYKSRYRFSAVLGGISSMNIFDKNQLLAFEVTDDGNNNVKLLLNKPNSFVGIGTTSFTDGTDTYKLSVAGNIRAQRVKVYTTWADYVFEDGYKLPTLEEVEQHIKEKGHLQDIPSAAEVKAKGIELGEMNKLLLQKIEELTLYTIELNKQVQELKANANKQ